MIKLIDEASRVPIKIWTDEIEQSALQQLRNTGMMPFVFKHVAAMPDVHTGLGSTVGSVVATKGAIIPACVGVDIGCGMSALHLPGVTPEDLQGRLVKLRRAIENSIPVGFDVHKAENGARALSPALMKPLRADYETIRNKARDRGHVLLERAVEKFGSQIGTLGGGNHFIELCLAKKNDDSPEDEVWLMLHSGSRGVGNQIGQHFINTAKGLMKKAQEGLPDINLAYLRAGSDEFDDYLFHMHWAQRFAYANRRAMQELVLRAIYGTLEIKRPHMDLPFIDCHHNYVAEEEHFGQKVLVTRKGAVRAGINDMGIIPGSMGARSFIVRGKGNPESFCSCSHGAGRRMSRTEAKRIFSTDDLKAQTKGIECRKDSGVVDEIPGAYKDIDVVMKNQEDLVSVERILRQVICVKG